MRKSFMVSEPSAPWSGQGLFLKCSGWAVLEAQQRGEGDAVQGQQRRPGLQSPLLPHGTKPARGEVRCSSKAGLTATSPRAGKEPRCVAQQHRPGGSHSAAEQSSGEKLVLYQNKMEIFYICDYIRPKLLRCG